MDSEVRKRPLLRGLASYLVKRFYAHAYPTLCGMSEMFHALFDWLQSLSERLLSGADGARLYRRVHALLFLLPSTGDESMEVV